MLGIELLPWQKWLLVHALELLPDGSYRFRKVVVLVARQNGKSTVMQVLTLWRMFVDDAPLVIGTAQDLDTAEEQWEQCVTLAEENDELAAEIAQVLKVNGKKQLKLTSGERYKVRAASRRGGRGLSGDLVLLDELREHQTWDAWSAVTKTTNARHRAQIWAASNAGDAASVVLAHLRLIAHLALGDPDGLAEDSEATAPPTEDEEGDKLGEIEIDRLGIFEWSAPPGCSVWDRGGWAAANPSLGYTITEQTLASDAGTDPEAVFRTECLCQWVLTMVKLVIPADTWRACEDGDSVIAGSPTFALDVAPDLGWAAIAAAGRRADGLPHIEITSRGEVVDHRPGVEWVVPRFVELAERRPGLRVSIVEGSAAAALGPALKAAGIEVVSVPLTEIGAACGLLYAQALAEDLRHLGTPELARALVAARKRQEEGETAWTWGRRRSTGDITPLYAVTVALWQSQKSPTVDVSVFSFNDLDACDAGCGKPHDGPECDYECRECYQKRMNE